MKKRAGETAMQPIIKVRSVLGGIVVIGLLIAGPLLTVWKQVYINSTSMKLEALSDSLTVLNRQIAGLRMHCTQLSRNERIEQFARSVLHLDYLTSGQIEIVHVANRPSMRNGALNEFFAFIKKSITRDRG